jgi:hypothetical protein
MRRFIPIFCSLICALAAVLPAQGQTTYTIDRSVISAGGGTISGGAYTLSGTIGQVDSGNMAGGIYQLDGGFWSLNVLVQTLGSPALAISHSGSNVTIFWSSSVAGFRLQTSAVVGPNANWQTVSGVANNSVSEPLSLGTHYYRLISP